VHGELDKDAKLPTGDAGSHKSAESAGLSEAGKEGAHRLVEMMCAPNPRPPSLRRNPASNSPARSLT
jgi:hypothetical protein